MNFSLSRLIEVTIAVAIGLAALVSWNYFKAKPLEAYRFDESLRALAHPTAVAADLRSMEIACNDLRPVTAQEFVEFEGVCASDSAPLRFFAFENPTKLMSAISTKQLAPSCRLGRRQYLVIVGLSAVRSPSARLMEDVQNVIGGAVMRVDCVER